MPAFGHRSSSPSSRTICLRVRFRSLTGMLELTRRRSTDARQECWHIRYGDLHAGTIAIRSGNPHDAKIHGSGAAASMGEHQSDTAATFEDARADFERAWLVFLSNRTDADFQAWRDERGIGPNGNTRCGKPARAWSRRTMGRASQTIDSAGAPAARSSTCTGRRRC